MSYTERKVMYQKIEEIRGNPLISYVTSIRPNCGAQMASDSIACIISQIEKIPDEKKEIDFLIISNGGDPITSLRIISILRERFDKITVLIPFVAYSAATILALGADDIIMHPYSNLGPVDPQLTVSKKNASGQQSNISFSSEDIRNYIDFLKSDIGITDQAQLASAFNLLSNEVGPLPIGSAKRSQQLSHSLSIKMLESHMHDKNKVETIAKALNSAYYHHGYAVGRTEATNMGLNITKPDKILELLLWGIWKDFEHEMKCNQAFDVVSEIMSNPEARAKLQSIPVINVPAHTPPNVINSIFTQYIQKSGVESRSSIEMNQLLASVESEKSAIHVNTTYTILYWRNPDMALSYNVTANSQGWLNVN